MESASSRRQTCFLTLSVVPVNLRARCGLLVRRYGNLCRPCGTRIYFPLYPALRLRLRADGLDYSAPTALDFPPTHSTGEYQGSFSHSRPSERPTLEPL